MAGDPTHRLSAAGVLSVAALMLAVAPRADACRCAERLLADYFEAADEVFIARLESVAVDDDRQFFTFDAAAPRLKMPRGTPLPYASYRSAASCAVLAEPGAVYAVFAQYDPATGVAWLTSCNGTRILLSTTSEPRGFSDVPPRFVPSQLNGLAGLEVLRQVAANEPSPGAAASEQLVGLLEIAAFGLGGKVDLRASPAASSGVVAAVESMTDLVHRESGYEVLAAVVYAVVDGWYKLRLGTGGFGWLAPESATTFAPLGELPVNRLAYLNQHWSGFVWPGPGAGLPSRSPTYNQQQTDRAEHPANVLESTRIGSSLWFRVEILSANGCEGKDVRVLLGGWVPAYGASGEPAAWFYSRGC